MNLNGNCAAICGLFCGTCDCFNDTCEGCLSNHVRGDCVACSNGFRACAKQHHVTRCYECEEMPCPSLLTFQKQHYRNGIGHHENVIEDLFEMNAIGVDAWVEQQSVLHTCPTCGKLIPWDEKHHKCT